MESTNTANKSEVLKKIEEDAEKKIKALKPFKVDVLVTIMKEGEKEFVEKMGRNMTYSEMRSAYG